MFKKIAITAILLGLFLAGSLIAENPVIWTVHITADPRIPTNGTVSVVIEEWPPPDPPSRPYHGPDNYYFEVTAFNVGKEITSTVVAGNYSDSETKIMHLNDLHVNLHLSLCVPYPYPEEPEPQEE